MPEEETLIMYHLFIEIERKILSERLQAIDVIQTYIY